MKELSNEEFNELMNAAIEIAKRNPNFNAEGVANVVCAKYEHRSDYVEILFQIIYNLVDLKRR